VCSHNHLNPAPRGLCQMKNTRVVCGNTLAKYLADHHRGQLLLELVWRQAPNNSRQLRTAYVSCVVCWRNG